MTLPLGVQLHLRKTGTPYYDLPRVIAALTDLGVTLARDSFNVGWPTQNTQIRQVAEACGVRFVLTARYSDTIAGFVAGVAALGDAVVAVEGVNEWDNTGRPGWVDELRTHQAALYAAVKAAMPNMPVLAPALANPANAGALGPVPCDLGNTHAYPNGFPDPWLETCRVAAGAVAGGKPVAVTETGYTNADVPSTYQHPLTEALAGANVAPLVRAHLAAGAPWVFVYELFDQGGYTTTENGFGLLRVDGTPKPAHAALKALLGGQVTTDPASILPAIACTDCLVTSGLCVYTSGPNAGKPRAARYGPHKVRVDASVVAAKWYDRGVSAGAASRQPDVDAARTRAEAAEAAVSKGQADVAALKAKVLDLQNQLAEELLDQLPTPDVTITPGQAPPSGKVVELAGGTYPGASWSFPNGTTTTLMAASGTTVILDGQGKTKRAITAGGRLDLLGDIRIVNYAPDAATGISCVPVYYGGTAAGSIIDGLTISGSTQAALAFQVPMVLTNLTVADCGYAGILYTTADGTTFGDVTVTRINRDHHARDGQVSAIKGTRSADVKMGKGVVVTDTGGAIGIWFDVSCRRPVVAGAKVLTGGGAPAYIGLLLEEAEGGTVVGVEVEGQYAGSLTASGHVEVWNSKFTGTTLGFQIRQDRPKNSGATAANLSPTLAPWWSVGNVLANCAFAGPTALGVWSDAAYQLTPADMASVKGCTFTGSTRPTNLPASLGAAYDPAAQPVPEAVAGLLT